MWFSVGEEATIMTQHEPLHPFPPSWADTRATLHGYLLALGAVPRAHAAPQPHWRHVGLRIAEEGFLTAPVTLPDGRALSLGLNPRDHVAWIDAGARHEIRLDTGITASDFGDEVLGEVVDLGLADDFDRDRYRSDAPSRYDRDAAGLFWGVLRSVQTVFERYRDGLDRDPGPVLMWPHHFDMSFEWYGSKSIPGEGGSESPSQLNLGFYPGDEQYFYSNPWPFDDSLIGTALPDGAAWHTDDWQGTILPYDALAGDPAWRERLQDYAAAVHRVARPTLMA